ncbi:methyltransferase domain-containing protein [Saccharothrix sp. SC076]|nr:methyltransferase domain-containing protein [Saccharothrix obliqua]
MRLLARTVLGVEALAAAEVAEFGVVRRIAPREVWWTCPEPGPHVLGLRCADDLFLPAAAVSGIGRARADLGRLTEAVAALDVAAVVARRARFGNHDRPPAVDVSASYLGRRNYNRFDLEDAAGEPLAAALGLPLHRRRHGAPAPPGSLSWRLTVADDRAVLALRVAATPLHRRAYRRASRPGALHPPLAAAMLRLADVRPGEVLLDPFCGTGTIPLEAGVAAIGADADPTAIAAARVNEAARPGGPGATWLVADAGRLPLASGSVDVVVTNPPWNRQVRAAGALATTPDRFWRELARVLTPSGRAVLLLPESAPPPTLPITDRRRVSLAGQHPEVITVRR